MSEIPLTRDEMHRVVERRGGHIPRVPMVWHKFYNGGTKIGEDTTAPYDLTWSPVAAGIYGVTARAIDNLGIATASTSTVTVTVTINKPPTITNNVAAPSGVIAPATLVLSAAATDTDGSVTKVEFLQGTTKLGEDTAAPFSWTWSGVEAGSYNVTARATDNGGATTTSAPSMTRRSRRCM